MFSLNWTGRCCCISYLCNLILRSKGRVSPYFCCLRKVSKISYLHATRPLKTVRLFWHRRKQNLRVFHPIPGGKIPVLKTQYLLTLKGTQNLLFEVATSLSLLRNREPDHEPCAWNLTVALAIKIMRRPSLKLYQLGHKDGTRCTFQVRGDSRQNFSTNRRIWWRDSKKAIGARQKLGEAINLEKPFFKSHVEPQW